jgi:hypothetical protein
VLCPQRLIVSSHLVSLLAPVQHSPGSLMRSRISCLAALDSVVYALFREERRMKLIGAFNLHRKSGYPPATLRCHASLGTRNSHLTKS